MQTCLWTDELETKGREMKRLLRHPDNKTADIILDRKEMQKGDGQCEF